MATVTHKVATGDTGTTPNTSGSFTPAVGDLLIVWVTMTGTTATTAQLTSSVGGFTFTQFANDTYNTNVQMFGFVADALVASATPQTVTISIPSDEGTGSNIVVEAVAGMTKVGLAAVRQFAKNNSSSSVAPNVTFASSVLTSNPTLCGCRENTNPATVTPPSGWTETADIGYSTPTDGLETSYRNSGFTGTTITWGSTEADWIAMAVELDASASATKKGGFGLMGMGR